MANRWGNNRKSERLYFLGPQNHSGWWLQHEIKRHLLFGRKAMTNLDSILKKERQYFADKSSYGQSYGFSSSHVWMWELDHKEGWGPANAFKLWCWIRLESPSDCKRSNQSILTEISPEYSLEGLMLKLKFQYFGHLMQRANSWEETLMLGKIEGRRRRGQQMRRLDGTQWTSVWASPRRWWRTGKPGVLQPMGSECWTRLSDWTHNTEGLKVKEDSVKV